MEYYMILINCIIFYIIHDFVKKNYRNKNEAVSVGIALPIIGHLHKVIGSNDQPHRLYSKFSKVYGNGVFKIWMGDHLINVIDEPNIARDLFNKNFKSFSNRPHLNSLSLFSNNFSGLAFSDFNKWRPIRTIVSSSVTKTKITNIYSSKFEKHAKNLISEMKEFANSGKQFEPFEFMHKFIISNIFSMLFNKEINGGGVDEDGDSNVTQLAISLKILVNKMFTTNLDDFIWFCSPFYYFSNLESKKVLSEIYSFIDIQFQSHLKELDEDNPKDLLDLLILSKDMNNKDDLFQTICDLIIAGLDTSSTTLLWCILYLVNNPDVQIKAYNELIQVIGNDCEFIETKHKESCPYVNSIIKEVLRIRTIAPLSVPRCVVNDITINDIFYPKGTFIFLNLFSMGNNEKYVKEPELFKPERWIENKFKKDNGLFSNDSIDEDGCYDLDYISTPFSVGPRLCPGANINDVVSFLSIANIILNFELNSTNVNNNKIDDREEFGITITPKPFSILLKSR